MALLDTDMPDATSARPYRLVVVPDPATLRLPAGRVARRFAVTSREIEWWAALGRLGPAARRAPKGAKRTLDLDEALRVGVLAELRHLAGSALCRELDEAVRAVTLGRGGTVRASSATGAAEVRVDVGVLGAIVVELAEQHSAKQAATAPAVAAEQQQAAPVRRIESARARRRRDEAPISPARDGGTAGPGVNGAHPAEGSHHAGQPPRREPAPGPRAPEEVAEILAFLRRSGDVKATMARFGVTKAQLGDWRDAAIADERRRRQVPVATGVLGPHRAPPCGQRADEPVVPPGHSHGGQRVRYSGMLL